MALIKTTINGKEIEVERDRWALNVIREMGIEVPTLCYHSALEPYGACRLCVVEVTKGKWTWLTTACDLPIREGLSIETNTEPVLNARKMALELMWSRAPESDELAALAKKLGIGKPKFKPKHDIGKCILCGLCVRVCDKLIGASAIGFVNRGNNRRVRTPFNAASEKCIGCNACVAVCPTGHILTVDKGNVREMQTWRTEFEMVECQGCNEPYIPVKTFEDIQAKLGDKLELEKVCPKCMRMRTVSKLAKASVSNK